MSSLFHRLSLAAVAAAAGLASTAAGAQTLTRIETHSFYGATVTIEEGVRVFRPLPPTSHMIINPGGRTPLSINYNTTIVDAPPPSTTTTTTTYYGPRGRAGLYGGYGLGRLGMHGAHRRHPGLYHVGAGRPLGSVRRLR